VLGKPIRALVVVADFVEDAAELIFSDVDLVREVRHRGALPKEKPAR
jgi:hypothetical protein